MLGLFLFAAVAVSAETVSSVSFNPSRLGNFEKLKISNSATLRGGLQVDNLNIGGAPSQTVCQTTTVCLSRDEAGNCLESGEMCVPQGVVAGGTVTLTSSRPISLKSVESPTDVAENSWNAFSAPNALFRAHGSSATGQLVPMNIMGGSLDFTDGDSTIQKLIAGNDLIAYARKITVSGTLNVVANEETRLLGQTSSADKGENVQGFKLGKIIIPTPTDATKVEYRVGANDSYTTQAPLDLSKCKLSWLKRKVNKDGTPEAEYVLGWTDKDSSTQCMPDCEEGIPAFDTYSTECGPGQVGNKHHRIIRKTYCNGTSDICYLTADGSDCTENPTNWDTNECRDALAWRRIDSWENHHRWPEWPQAISVENGRDFCWGVDSRWGCIGISGHWIGVDETKCYVDSNHRLHIGDSVTVPGLQWFLDSNVTFRRLIVNRVYRTVHCWTTLSGNQVCDVVSDAPPCDESHSGNEGKVVEESVYALNSVYGNIVPGIGDLFTSCVGVDYTIKYKCSRN